MKSPFRTAYMVCVTQDYGNTSNNAWYQANGVTAPFHNGIDIVTSFDSQKTYGTECVCPFEKATVVKVIFDTPTSTKGNGVTIQSEPKDGVIYQVVFWHTGEVPVKIGQVLKEGDVVCYIGNSGLCNPKPTAERPWDGAHCHLMLFKFQLVNNTWVLQNADNGVGGAINPASLFDFKQWYIGKDTDKFSHDGWALVPWINNYTGNKLVAYLKRMKFW